MRFVVLLQGGEPDLMTTAKMVLHDWQRGKIPFFVPPPQEAGTAPPENANEADSNKEEQNEVKVAQLTGVEIAEINQDVAEIDESDEDETNKEKEMTNNSNRKANVMKAIAEIISSQQNLNIPDRK
jgi:nuclear GTP-binding protein